MKENELCPKCESETDKALPKNCLFEMVLKEYLDNVLIETQPTEPNDQSTEISTGTDIVSIMRTAQERNCPKLGLFINNLSNLKEVIGSLKNEQGKKPEARAK